MTLLIGIGLHLRGAGLGSGILSTTFSGLTSGEARPGDHASISADFPGGVTSWTSQAWGVGSYGDSTYGTGSSPTDYTASDGSTLLWEGLGDDGNTYRVSAPIRYAAPVSAGSLADQSFTDDTGNQTFDVSGDFTFSGTEQWSIQTGPAGVTIDGAGVVTFDTNALAEQTGTAIVVRLSDANDPSRFADSGFSLDITAAGAPVTINSVTFTDNNDGTPASLLVNYSGDATGKRVYIATGGAGLAVTDAQLFAGSGGTDTIEFTDYAVGTDIDVTGLTSASEAATQIAVAIIQTDGSNPSNVVLEAVSGLDFTNNQLASAATNGDGTIVNATMLQGNYGTEDTANWTVRVNASPITVSAVSITPGNDTVSLTVSPAITAGQTVDISYSGGDLVDPDENPLSDITQAAVTNNVSSWTPASDANTVAWYDASDASTITHSTVDGNEVVSQINDKSGNNYHLSTITGSPVTDSVTQNGLNVIDFDGSSAISGSITLADTSGDYLVSFVVSVDAITNASDSVISFDGNGTNNDWQLDAGSGSTFDGRLSAANLITPDTFTSSTTPSGYEIWQLEFDHTGGTVTLYLNNVSVGSATSDVASWQNQFLRLFANRAVNQFPQGNFAELFATSDETTRGNAYTYLSSKWAA